MLGGRGGEVSIQKGREREGMSSVDMQIGHMGERGKLTSKLVYLTIRLR